jgi:hypothetical protein
MQKIFFSGICFLLLSSCTKYAGVSHRIRVLNNSAHVILFTQNNETKTYNPNGFLGYDEVYLWADRNDKAKDEGALGNDVLNQKLNDGVLAYIDAGDTLIVPSKIFPFSQERANDNFMGTITVNYTYTLSLSEADLK